MKHLVTPRLLMRPFAESDFDDFFRLCSDAEAMHYIPPFRPLTLEETAESLQKMIGDFMKSGYGIFAVIERKEKRFIGWCGSRQLESSGLTELHFAFNADALAKGYGVEASMEILRSAFNDWGLEKIVAECRQENKAFIHVMERIGLHYEQHAGFHSDMVLYSIEKPKETTDSIFEHSYQNSSRLSLRAV